MGNGSTILNLLPKDAHARLCDAANKLDSRELARIIYFYVQTLDEAQEIVELLLRTKSNRFSVEAVQTEGTDSSSRVSQCHN